MHPLTWGSALLSAAFLSTCTEYKRNNANAKDGNYTIDPDGAGGLGPFKVFCDMTSEGGVGITVISHDTEQRTRADSLANKQPYIRNVTYYGASLAQLGALTTLSTKCEQYISYECHDSRLLAKGASWWRSRDGRKMKYWGGAPPGSKKCACGVTNTCDIKGKKCNCDSNKPGVIHKDDGILGEKADLPVTEMRFGDVEHDEEWGFHILGKLRCSGYQACTFEPCANGGTCQDLPNDYTCNCKQGYTGKQCQTGLLLDLLYLLITSR